MEMTCRVYQSFLSDETSATPVMVLHFSARINGETYDFQEAVAIDYAVNLAERWEVARKAFERAGERDGD